MRFEFRADKKNAFSKFSSAGFLFCFYIVVSFYNIFSIVPNINSQKEKRAQKAVPNQQ